jgi:hypothetical protein
MAEYEVSKVPEIVPLVPFPGVLPKQASIMGLEIETFTIWHTIPATPITRILSNPSQKGPATQPDKRKWIAHFGPEDNAAVFV